MENSQIFPLESDQDDESDEEDRPKKRGKTSSKSKSKSKAKRTRRSSRIEKVKRKFFENSQLFYIEITLRTKKKIVMKKKKEKKKEEDKMDFDISEKVLLGVTIK